MAIIKAGGGGRGKSTPGSQGSEKSSGVRLTRLGKSNQIRCSSIMEPKTAPEQAMLAVS